MVRQPKTAVFLRKSLKSPRRQGVKLMLHSQNLSEAWEEVLQDALHATRSLLCTSTNATPHKLFFNFQRRSMLGTSLPNWLVNPWTVLLRRHVRNKGDPLCDEVDLVDANPSFARVRLPDGRESTVSTNNLARCPQPIVAEKRMPITGPAEGVEQPLTRVSKEVDRANDKDRASEMNTELKVENHCDSMPTMVRRLTRERKPPDRYGNWAP